MHADRLARHAGGFTPHIDDAILCRIILFFMSSFMLIMRRDCNGRLDA